MHNRYRNLHRAQPLEVDKTLVTKAQTLVKDAAKTGGFGEVAAGENVYQVCATYNVGLTATQVTRAWLVFFFH